MAKTNHIVSTNYPYIEVRFRVRDQENQVWAFLDTGFDGGLIAPEALLQALALPDHIEPVELANGQILFAPGYKGSLEVLGLNVIIPVVVTALGDEYLLGRSIMDRFKVTFDHGQRVEVEG